jgi:hypothetical protein
MTNDILAAPAELFLGSSITTARELGPRHFRSADKAIRFAMEQAAPVSLRGASLRIGGRTLGPRQIRALHRQMTPRPQSHKA